MSFNSMVESQYCVKLNILNRVKTWENVFHGLLPNLREILKALIQHVEKK